MAAIKSGFDVAEFWKGADNGARLFHTAMARLAEAPMTLTHGDVNPGNIWKSKLGKTGDDKYCFIDWQLCRMAPAAFEFAAGWHGICPASAYRLSALSSNTRLKSSIFSYE